MNQFRSMFRQLWQLFPKTEFYQAVKRTMAERHARGFTCWGQDITLFFCRLGRPHSLQEITGTLTSRSGLVKSSV